MKRTTIYIPLFLFFLGICPKSHAQDTIRLTLQDAIRMAQDHSPAAVSARHTFRSAYWDYRSFRANLLPSLSLSVNPYLNRSIGSVTLEDGSDIYVHRNQLSTNATLNLNQNIPLTGGSLYAYTSLNRIDLFNTNTYSYMTQPLVVGYSQNLFGYNSLKWNKKTEPLRYKRAKKTLIETMEAVAGEATYRFFQLAIAQSSLEIAKYNYANADTLYQIAQGRYNIGTITENDMLQLEISKLREQTNIMDAEISVDNCIQSLRQYLTLDESSEIIVLIEDWIPDVHVPVEKALEMAYENNPEIDYREQVRINSESSVAYAKSQRGFNSNLFVEFGLTQTDGNFSRAYRNPVDQQSVSLGIRIPILDWGVGKGKVKVALSERDKTYLELEQQEIDFTKNIINYVKQFNIQSRQVEIARKKDQTTMRRNEIAHQLYLTGKITILELNTAIAEKDSARNSYLRALYQYWSYYYLIRRMTGYDFRYHRELTFDYELLMK